MQVPIQNKKLLFETLGMSLIKIDRVNSLSTDFWVRLTNVVKSSNAKNALRLWH